jgi:hypothetical protein
LEVVGREGKLVVKGEEETTETLRKSKGLGKETEYSRFVVCSRFVVVFLDILLVHFFLLRPQEMAKFSTSAGNSRPASEGKVDVVLAAFVVVCFTPVPG